jgi:ribosomal protein L11 methyltransferase
MCIQALERTVKQGDQVIDVGTGSGVLSIAAAMLGSEKTRAFDLDEVAVRSARLNIKLNKVNEAVSVAQNNLLDNVEENSADVVVANILAEVILRFTDDAARVVKPGGCFITSGIINAKKDLIKDDLIRAGFTIEETLVMEDWVAIIARKK